jgi:hypothetical protein
MLEKKLSASIGLKKQRRFDGGAVLHVDHRMRNVAPSCNPDGLTDGRSRRREDDAPRDQYNLVQPFQTAVGGRIHF